MKCKKTIEKIVFGDEPVFDRLDYSQAEFITFLNYYNYNSNHQELKEYTLEYVLEYNSELYTTLNDVPKTLFKGTLGALCRMVMRNYPISDYIVDKINNQLSDLAGYAIERTQTKPIEPHKQKPVVDKVEQSICDIDGFIDVCISSGVFITKDWKKFILEYKLKKDDGEHIAEYYTKLLTELRETNEGYALPKKDFEKFTNIIESVVTEFSNVSNYARAKKQRTKKPVDKNKLVAKTKFLDKSTELDVISKSPIDVIGAKSVLLYNTKYKKIQLIVAEEALSIRGSTIYGIDKEKSISKIVKKPNAIPNFMSGNTQYITHEINSMNTKASVPTGALNIHTLILRVIQ